MTAGAVLDLLARGDVDVKGRMPWSSNATFLVDLCLEGVGGRAIYKPERGERPLWDFPPGLYRREVAAYELSEALGWGIVPPTIIRLDAPLGGGSLQEFVEADFDQHYFTLLDEPRHQFALKRICLFDLLANNADRKSGHCLLGLDGRIHAIDHGLSFHADLKLRTVIWDFGGERIPSKLLDDVARFAETGLPDELAAVLDHDECDALVARTHMVLRDRCFPTDPSGRRYPWPMV